MRWVLKSAVFENACIFLVVLNSGLQGFQADYCAINNLMHAPWWLTVANNTFTMLFCAEILLRLYAYQRLFFVVDLGWNLFDAFIAVLSLVDFIVSILGLTFDNTSSVSINAVRPLRILRVVLVVRIIRVLRFFRELRTMIYSIIGCLRSLFWAISLLLMLLYSIACYFTQVATTYRADATTDDQLALDLKNMYGHLFLSIYNLFQAISGGADWGDVAGPLLELGWGYAVFFSIFMCFTLFAVLNIVTGVFVEGAIDRAAQDRDSMIQHEMEQHQSSVKELEKVFAEIDVDGSGILELAEFELLLKDQRVKAWFRTMGLQIETAMHMFRLLDMDNSNTVSASEFVMGCMRLQGGAKNIDVATLMYENKRMMTKWTAFMDYVEEKLDELKAHVSTTISTSTVSLAGCLGASSEAFNMPEDWAQASQSHTKHWSKTTGSSVNIY